MNERFLKRLNELSNDEIDEIRAQWHENHLTDPNISLADIIEMFETADYTYDDELELNPNITPDEFIFWWRENY